MIPEKEIDGQLWIRAVDHHQAIKNAQRTWVGLSLKNMPDKWLGNRQFIVGAKWAAKYLKEKNT